MKTSMRTRIKQAASETELEELNREAQGYKDASPQTRRKWRRDVEKRLEQLQVKS